MQQQGREPVRRRKARRVTLSMPLSGAVAGAAVLTVALVWSAAATTYALFHDEVIADLARRFAERERYHDAARAELAGEAERERSRAAIERRNAAERLATLNARIAEIERRQGDIARLAGAPLPASPAPAAPEPDLDLRPAAAADEGWEKDFELRSGEAAGRSAVRIEDDGAPDADFRARLDRLTDAQDAAIGALRGKLTDDGERLLAAARRLGIDTVQPRDARNDTAHGPQGGPFVPLGAPDAGIAELLRAAARNSELAGRIGARPVRAPIPELEVTSRFGGRNDPFLDTPAYHTGVDLRSEVGAGVAAAAGGTVTEAGWNGGYGLMVEVDHGGGVTSRYAHLSSVLVTPGQAVKAGDTLGTSGSTGRSTGPHLHFEVRLGGTPVDPEPYLAVGRKVADLLPQG